MRGVMEGLKRRKSRGGVVTQSNKKGIGVSHRGGGSGGSKLDWENLGNSPRVWSGESPRPSPERLPCVTGLWYVHLGEWFVSDILDRVQYRGGPVCTYVREGEDPRTRVGHTPG